MKITELLLCAFLILPLLSNAQIEAKNHLDPTPSKAKADKHFEDKDFKKALQIYENLQVEACEQEDWLPLLSVGLQQGITLQKLGKKRESVEFFKELESKIEGKVPEDHEELLMLYHKTGVGYHLLANYTKAITYYHKAVVGREKDPIKYRIDLIKGYYNIGNLYYSLGNYDLALDYLKRSTDKQTDSPTKELYRAYQVTARVYRELGDFDQAISYLGPPKTFYQDQQSLKKLASVLIDFANIYIDFEKTDRAIGAVNEAIDVFHQYPIPTGEDSTTLANAFHILGDAYRISGSFDPAIKAYFQSLAINLKIYGGEHYKTARSYNNIGITYLEMNQLDSAEKNLLKALEIKQKWGNSKELGSTYNNLGDLHMALQNYEKATEYYHFSLCYSSPFCDSLDYRYQLSKREVIGGDRIWIVHSMAAKANALHALYSKSKDHRDLFQAYCTYSMVDDLIDMIRFSYQMDHSKGFLTGKTKEIYSNAIQLCLEIYEQTQEKKYFEAALAFSEKSKSIILLEAILKSNEELFKEIDPEIRKKERHFRIDLAVYEKQLGEAKLAKDSSKVSLLMDQLLKTNKSYQELLDSIKKAHPNYFQLLHNSTTVSLHDIQKKIVRRGQIMIEYFIGQEEIYAFVIGKRSYDVAIIPLDFPITEWVGSIRQGIYAYHKNAQQEGQTFKEECQMTYADYGYRLYQKLIQPLEIYNLRERLLIIPDEVMGYLPFDALLTRKVEDIGHFPTYPFLLKQHEISQANSATVLLNQLNKKDDFQPGTLLAVAPSFKTSLPSSNKNILGPLLFNEKEVSRICEIFSGKIISGPNALKNTFLEFAKDHRIIHISSHAKASDIDPNHNSFIAFTQEKPHLNEEQLLYLWELYNLRLDAEMIVLSACETGIGKLMKGEGILSLSRAFFYSGAKSVITTLWSVDDHQSSDLMVQFYKNLNEGHSKSRALTQAKRSFVTNKRDADPYYWAGFVAMGNMKPLRTNSWPKTIGMVILLGLILGGVYFYRKKFSRAIGQ